MRRKLTYKERTMSCVNKFTFLRYDLPMPTLGLVALGLPLNLLGTGLCGIDQ